MITDYITPRIPKVLSDHPELGISTEDVNGRRMYRHTPNQNAIGVWISGAKVRDIVGTIPSSATTVDSAVAGAVVDVIQRHNLGEENLRIAQRKHYNAYLNGTSNLLPEFAAKKARELAGKYDLGPEAIARAITENVNLQKKDSNTSHVNQPLEDRV